MQKRVMVSMPLWMAEYFQDLATHYDQNSSDIIRLILCSGILKGVEIICPDYESFFDNVDLDKIKKEYDLTDATTKHIVQERASFETQKAIEYRRKHRPLKAKGDKNA